MLTEPYSPMLKIERLITQNNFVPDFLITDIIVLILLLIFYWFFWFFSDKVYVIFSLA